METETIPEAPKILGTAKVLASILITKYDRRESGTLARILVEFILQKPYKWLLMHPDAIFSPQEYFEWNQAVARLLADEPIQYITGSASFYGLEIGVQPGVLIPRPETEELVEWILQSTDAQSPIQIVDVGTGSGCIALALAHARPAAAVTGIDVSPIALTIAQANAERLGIPCVFHNCDVLAATKDAFAGLDVLVSNPPYIPQSEYAQLAPHVRLHEPALALAVPDSDPLHYYIKVSELGRHWLRPGGWLYFEIHEGYGAEMVALLEGLGYVQVTLRQDMAGRNRMIAGQNPG